LIRFGREPHDLVELLHIDWILLRHSTGEAVPRNALLSCCFCLAASNEGHLIRRTDTRRPSAPSQ
jgi:hypothetical protein